jgi:hypothetical protein
VVYCAAIETGSGMTVQDVLPGLGEDEDERQSETATPRRGRWLLAGTLATVTALAGVVVVVQRLAVTTPPAWTAATSTAPAPVTTDTAATPQQGSVLIKAALDYPGLINSVVPTAPLVVGTEPVQGGAAPDRVPNFDSCHADAASLQYLPFQVRMPENWLSATFTIQTTANTPADIGRLGFFFQAGPASTPCPNGAWSTSDSFQASNTGQEVITGYAVLDRAFTASTPQGRTGVFGTLGLRISNIRLSGRPAAVSPPSVGVLCPGTRDELCASLG